MTSFRNVSALAMVGMAVVAGSAFAADPSATPGTAAPAGPPQQPQAQQPQQPQGQSLPKSDPDRIVGKVVQLDRQQGQVAVATDEGVIVVQASPQQLETVNIGDLVSIPRSAAQSPSASPRE
jgi:hypothetical protein